MRGVRGGRPGRPGDAVLVTGSSTGLGLETALYLAQRGFRVFASVRDEASGEAVRQAALTRGVGLDVLQLDLTDGDSIAAAVATVAERAGGVFGLVNNGGIGLRGAVEDCTEDEIRRVFETNVIGTIAVTKAVLPHMRSARCGRIVTVSSIGGRVCGFGVAVYCASKFAQEGLGEGLALELAEFGIQSVLVEPGMIRTSRWGEHRGTAAAAREPGGPYHARFTASEAIADRIVTRSPTRPADVAATIAEALTAEQPRLRYVVGRGARVVVLARRLLPERTFERLYFGGQLRRLERRAGPRSVAPPAAADPEPERVG
jgi:NAD(P)-dependent dehydrogenase (short-subunit alcohol dehydrogenase family)